MSPPPEWFRLGDINPASLCTLLFESKHAKAMKHWAVIHSVFYFFCLFCSNKHNLESLLLKLCWHISFPCKITSYVNVENFAFWTRGTTRNIDINVDIRHRPSELSCWHDDSNISRPADFIMHFVIGTFVFWLVGQSVLFS